LRDLGAALPRIKSRLAKLVPAPVGRVPIMIGGGGEKVTLKLTAQHADMWNTFPPVDTWRRKNRILTEWCHKVGRDPRAIERTCSISPDLYGQIDDLLDAGVEHFILRGPQPFNAPAVEELLRLSGR
jgi:alkanesulfonate monooxygenase SsuD/methylene tetrahydromethanopterin reductase-like flavin-dependent oxidoreductase (luciferase family)